MANHVLRVDQSPGENGSNDCENQKPNIGAIRYSPVLCDVDILAQWNLE